MAIRREFLDWNQPFLPQAARWLIAQSQATATTRVCDLQHHVCVLPGSRAGRLLLGRLMLECRERGLALLPPALLTPGSLVSSLTGDQPVATAMEAILAWTEALRGASAEAIKPVLPHRPDIDDELGWHELAEMIANLHAELAGSQVSFGEAGDAAERLEMPAEGDRWRALEHVHGLYIRSLHRAGLHDPHEARRSAIARRTGSGHDGRNLNERLVLLAVPELNVVQRAAIHAFNGNAVALIHAPSRLRDHFDEFGCVVAEAWTEAAIHIDDDQLHVVGQPSEQATQAMCCIASFDGAYSAGEIAIGVGDEALVPFIRRAADRSGLRVRWAAGTPLRDSAPLRFLAAAADWLDEPRFANFTALLRHPDVDRWVAASIERPATEEWISLLDTYFADHLHERLSGEWLGKADRRARLKEVFEAALRLLSPLQMAPSGSTHSARHPQRTLGSWCPAVLEVLANLYAEPSDATRACLAFRDEIAQLSSVPESLQPRVNAAEALRLLLKHAGNEPLIEERTAGQVELLGWLELHLDPAPALVITGMNDGFIPHTLPTGPFLPDSLRGALGMPTHVHRYARDAYLIEAIRQSRSVLQVIAGRQSVENDSLLPSRLLLSCDDESLVRRVSWMCGDATEHTRTGDWELKSELTQQDNTPQSSVPVTQSPVLRLPPLPPLTPPTSMRVTDFALYLACPYRYALRRLVNLQEFDDRLQEMDPRRFGSLAHEVLRAFGENQDIAECTDATTIESYLIGELATRTHRCYGTSPLPAVRVQIAQMEQRLRSFAAWQAVRRSEGWRIRHCEYKFDGSIALDIPGQDAMPLHAAIDRIDFNDATGEWAILDYKTGDSGDSPHKKHHGRLTLTDAPEWQDLQLPLYHYLATRAALGITGTIHLGYITLPKRSDGTAIELAAWNRAHLEQAWNAAREVVTSIRAGEFDFNPDHTSPFDPFARICQTTVFGRIAADEGEEESEAA